MPDDESKRLPVRIHDGSPIEENRTYFRVLPFVLRCDTPLPFNLYQYDRESGAILLFLEAGGSLSERELHEIGEREAAGNRVYARGDHRQALANYQEAMLDSLLHDDAAPMDVKCGVLQNQTRLLSLELIEKPNAHNLQRQKKNVGNMVDFVTREPDAMRGLVALTYHDYYTYTHSVNVGLYGLWIAMEHFNDLDGESLRNVASAFFLHDIGKCRVPSAIINKPGHLNAEEWVEIRRHPDHGYDILRQESGLSEEAAIVTLQHHERLDGKGYPKGLRADKIHVFARVCSLADAFDALTTRRSYKPALSHFRAMKIMRNEMHEQFDSSIFKTFVQQWAKNAEKKS